MYFELFSSSLFSILVKNLGNYISDPIPSLTAGMTFGFSNSAGMQKYFSRSHKNSRKISFFLQMTGEKGKELKNITDKRATYYSLT